MIDGFLFLFAKKNLKKKEKSRTSVVVIVVVVVSIGKYFAGMLQGNSAPFFLHCGRILTRNDDVTDALVIPCRVVHLVKRKIRIIFWVKFLFFFFSLFNLNSILPRWRCWEWR